MGEQVLLGRSGHIAGYDVLIRRDQVWVGRGDDADWHEIPNYGTAVGDLMARPAAALGWAQMPDGAEVLYFYDRDDDGFGYGLNLTDPMLSEWGYAPFRPSDQDDDEEDAGMDTTPTICHHCYRALGATGHCPVCRWHRGEPSPYRPTARALDEVSVFSDERWQSGDRVTYDHLHLRGLAPRYLRDQVEAQKRTHGAVALRTLRLPVLGLALEVTATGFRALYYMARG